MYLPELWVWKVKSFLEKHTMSVIGAEIHMNMFLPFALMLNLVVVSMKEKVYEVVKTIPKGKVATYGQIALYLGNKNLARVVGNILHNNPEPENVPCHRVVNCNGRLANSYAFGGLEAQKILLESEGVVFKDNNCVDLKVSQVSFVNEKKR